jgi:hypothetical protein
LSASVLLVLGAFRSAFLAAPSVGVTAASQGTLSLCRRFGRGDFMALVDVEGVFYATVLVGGTRQATAATKWASIPACSGIENDVFHPRTLAGVVDRST